MEALLLIGCDSVNSGLIYSKLQACKASPLAWTEAANAVMLFKR